MINSKSFFNRFVTKITLAKHASGKTIVVMDGNLSKANRKSIDEVCPSDISRSNRPIALLIQKTSVNTNKKKTKIKANCLNMYWSNFCTDKIPSMSSSLGFMLSNHL